MMQQDIHPLRTFVAAVTEIMHEKLLEPLLLLRIRPLLEFLISERNWLPEQFCRENPECIQEYLLFCDPLQRFSVVCSVLAPGQKSPIQDYPVWGIISVIRGVGMRRIYSYVDYHLVPRGTERVGEGTVILVKPDSADIHEISNAQANAPYVSVGIFGGNIGTLSRHRFDAATRQPNEFTSGYANTVLPNLWSTAARADAPIKPSTSLH
jgi:predicted metal-dependent enzyme (double-stranded beta helix superfamily)